MIERLFNPFRKNKRYVFHADRCCSGTGPAVDEFNYYKTTLEQATDRPVRMISTNNLLGYSYIVYEIVYKEEQEENNGNV